ncbi:unnamed protein product [Schistocephalus solidus]|uniref:Uncharacterized protein n=1 Tax=Schistocephalus solidus TaxID=70667 RepID=A0A183S842_SCHSO|nr:unnamed protein product [Schistocephalus solidus]
MVPFKSSTAVTPSVPAPVPPSHYPLASTPRGIPSLNATNTGKSYGFAVDVQINNQTNPYLQPPYQPRSFLLTEAAHTAHNPTVGTYLICSASHPGAHTAHEVT